MKKKEKKVGNRVFVLLSFTRFPQKDTWRRGGEGETGSGGKKGKKDADEDEVKEEEAWKKE